MNEFFIEGVKNQNQQGADGSGHKLMGAHWGKINDAGADTGIGTKVSQHFGQNAEAAVGCYWANITT